MKRITFVIGCSVMGMAASAAYAGDRQAQAAPTRAEIQQKAMQEGPSTPQLGYLTHKDPVGPHRAAAPVDPRLLRPLTQREMGMLYNACIAYPECATAYSRAYEHNQALLKAQQSADGAGQ